ncbi:glutathione-regulated potassium-efflux system oxidoreductase KefF [Permianibacter sp. IMCC34836]|uniref:glutathione-regulated potassium-efflux system oxidoreductase KefF n=1 Tax=Permianibacter fluminis TaxID=2738515 RepID=UPI001553E4CC|nr:glutathione-regulated potassium-efflux system oxidoreductase KefF [Permianibacter fluminis]NQD36716.1 glutathione-regulated potassium-efflux system oxidoreductase KefF [Permianibacter fluminis]
MICVIYAHPYPARSRTGRALLDAVGDLPSVHIRSLYQLYPDFDIDVDTEQQALVQAQLIVWMHPLYWYSTPALLTLWFEKVLARDWAYGDDGNALRGKDVLWVTTTGAPAESYQREAEHGHPFATFVPPLSQTARFCGMRWHPPIVVHQGHRCAEHTLQQQAQQFRARLQSYPHWPEPDHAG